MKRLASLLFAVFVTASFAMPAAATSAGKALSAGPLRFNPVFNARSGLNNPDFDVERVGLRDTDADFPPVHSSRSLILSGNAMGVPLESTLIPATLIRQDAGATASTKLKPVGTGSHPSGSPPPVLPPGNDGMKTRLFFSGGKLMRGIFLSNGAAAAMQSSKGNPPLVPPGYPNGSHRYYFPAVDLIPHYLYPDRPSSIPVTTPGGNPGLK
jgi:hypothetical protein